MSPVDFNLRNGRVALSNLRVKGPKNGNFPCWWGMNLGRLWRHYAETKKTTSCLEPLPSDFCF